VNALDQAPEVRRGETGEGSGADQVGQALLDPYALRARNRSQARATRSGASALPLEGKSPASSPLGSGMASSINSTGIS
jgi:hypothetical protein